MPLLLQLGDELLHLISETLRFSLNPDAPQDRPNNQNLKPLSATCSRMRAITLPILFRTASNLEVKTGCHEVPALWPHIRYQVASPGELSSVLPKLFKLRRLCLVGLDTPPEALFFSISSLQRTLDCLEFQVTRLDNRLLAEPLSQLSSVTSLILKANSGRVRPYRWTDADDDDDDDVDSEILESNVSKILNSLAPTLVHLEIAGDFVRFKTLASIKWPHLCTLKLGNHFLSRELVSLSIFVSQMPRLSVLALDFRADSKEYVPVIFCPDDSGPSLCTVLPDLQALSISNCHPNDGIIAQLPKGLKSLRVCALRDHPDRHDEYGSAPLDEIRAYCWIKAASRLDYLVELALTLEKPQSRELLELIANACPKLQTLELEQDRFENNDNDEGLKYESYVESLQRLTHLRHLRLTIEVGPHHHPRIFPYPRVRGNEHRFPIVCRFFAERLPSLITIGLLYHNPLGQRGLPKNLGISDRSSVWYTASIYRGKEGEVPSVQFWKYA